MINDNMLCIVPYALAKRKKKAKKAGTKIERIETQCIKICLFVVEETQPFLWF